MYWPRISTHLTLGLLWSKRANVLYSPYEMEGSTHIYRPNSNSALPTRARGYVQRAESSQFTHKRWKLLDRSERLNELQVENPVTQLHLSSKGEERLMMSIPEPMHESSCTLELEWINQREKKRMENVRSSRFLSREGPICSSDFFSKSYGTDSVFRVGRPCDKHKLQLFFLPLALAQCLSLSYAWEKW